MVQELIVKLTEEYEKQIKLYQSMQEAAKVQMILCTEADFKEEGNIKKLTRLLFKKQEQMEKIEESQSKTNTIKDSLQKELGVSEINGPTLASLYPHPETEKLQKILARLNSLLTKITALDTTSQKALQDKLCLVKDDLQKIQKGKQAKKAYKPVKKQPEGFFFDQK
ncbi:flagellar export chaperone FlgN [Candidatus Contubernalis alkaliaceticus]|uniref:flagellar export chaperone FlgN n=1 Tax=Candidatus Contubernalis alkaliaceticus TaxID=338645 RepID=UPI001F4C4786|nr:flagellar export chaperone FlgN [Candidatus Contubernalis alkalaceticus]UNC91737.1 flagellar protein FlgN [Candidatus Contubernalis alkalaceticus]